MMNFCSNCGNNLNQNATHCGCCGKYIGNNNTNTNDNNVNNLNTNQNNTVNNNSLNNCNTSDDKMYNNVGNLTKSKKYARISFILSILPIILGCLVFVLFALMYSSIPIISYLSGIAFVPIILLFNLSIGIGNICSLVFSIMSLSYKKNMLAIISIFINLIPVFFILFAALFNIFEK